ncbi:ABC transporter permease [uncultured Jatrophihabitans sp.]|uniref:ABC transporter permease n=1 Tax=uncultured Jatrophihabitans sp. TaxID=1610747 RepID=UPI0035CBE5A4
MTLSDQGDVTTAHQNIVDGIDGAMDGVEPDRARDTAPGPTGAHPANAARKSGDRVRSLASRYALLGVWILMAGLYAVMMPHKFVNVSTFQAIFGSQSALLFLAVSALCTFVVGEFDLSFASVMGLSATIIPVLSTLHHVNLFLACLVSLGVALCCGVLNAVFIVKLGVPSLIVTLGTASLFLGIAELISSSTIVSVSNKTFTKMALHNVLGLPLSFYYGLILCAGFAYVLAWMPIGRHIVFVGANREVARLAGISVDRIRAGSYIVASLVAGLAGILLVATVGGFDPTASSSYLLPALAAVFLGTAIVMPGQFNPMGTFLGIYFLETGILGLQLLGYTGWVQDAFYGAGLVLAVTVACVVRSRTRTA